MQRMQELGIVSGKTRNEIERIMNTTKDGAAAWDLFTGSVAKFDGMMGKMSQTASGKLSTLSDNWWNVKATVGDEILPILNRGIEDLLAELQQLQQSGKLREWGEAAARALGELYENAKALGSWVAENKDLLAAIGITAVGVSTIYRTVDGINALTVALRAMAAAKAADGGGSLIGNIAKAPVSGTVAATGIITALAGAAIAGFKANSSSAEAMKEREKAGLDQVGYWHEYADFFNPFNTSGANIKSGAVTDDELRKAMNDPEFLKRRQEYKKRLAEAAAAKKAGVEPPLAAPGPTEQEREQQKKERERLQKEMGDEILRRTKETADLEKRALDEAKKNAVASIDAEIERNKAEQDALRTRLAGAERDAAKLEQEAEKAMQRALMPVRQQRRLADAEAEKLREQERLQRRIDEARERQLAGGHLRKSTRELLAADDKARAAQAAKDQADAIRQQQEQQDRMLAQLQADRLQKIKEYSKKANDLQASQDKHLAAIQQQLGRDPAAQFAGMSTESLLAGLGIDGAAARINEAADTMLASADKFAGPPANAGAGAGAERTREIVNRGTTINIDTLTVEADDADEFIESLQRAIGVQQLA